MKTDTKASVQKALKNGNFDMVLCAVNTSILPDLTFLCNSSGRMNYSGYSDAGLNNLLTNIYETSDEAQFKYLFSQLQLKIADGLPFLGLFFRKGTLMTTANVTGFSPVLETDALHGIEYLEFE